MGSSANERCIDQRGHCRVALHTWQPAAGNSVAANSIAAVVILNDTALSNAAYKSPEIIAIDARLIVGCITGSRAIRTPARYGFYESRLRIGNREPGEERLEWEQLNRDIRDLWGTYVKVEEGSQELA